MLLRLQQLERGHGQQAAVALALGHIVQHRLRQPRGRQRGVRQLVALHSGAHILHHLREDGHEFVQLGGRIQQLGGQPLGGGISGRSGGAKGCPSGEEGHGFG